MVDPELSEETAYQIGSDFHISVSIKKAMFSKNS